MGLEFYEVTTHLEGLFGEIRVRASTVYAISPQIAGEIATLRHKTRERTDRNVIVATCKQLTGNRQGDT